MTYKFEFSAEVLQIVALGLRKLPYEQSASLLEAMQKEVQAQDAAAVTGAGQRQQETRKVGLK